MQHTGAEQEKNEQHKCPVITPQCAERQVSGPSGRHRVTKNATERVSIHFRIRNRQKQMFANTEGVFRGIHM